VNPARVLEALAGGAARRPLAVLAVAVVLGVGCALLAAGLQPNAATDTFVSRSSSTYSATQRFYSNFGEEPIEVMVKGELQKLLQSSDIERLAGLEGCLSGNVPAKALTHEGGANGPCGQLAKAKTVKVVLGPGTFLNEAAEVINTQLAAEKSQAETQAEQAQHVVYETALAKGRSVAEATSLGKEAGEAMRASFARSVAELALRYRLTAPPSLADPNFVSTVVFDPSKPAGTPKERFAYLFPSRNAALISVRLKSGLKETARSRALELIAAALRMPQWHLQYGRYLLTGEPAIISQLSGSISSSLKLLLAAVVLVMALALSLIFWGRPRLLPLAIALLATALTFGVLAALGSSLTVAQVAVLPVLVGLAVDYAIQFQSRVQEAFEHGATSPAQAVRTAAAAGAPTIATAALASAAAMLVLELSPVPMVRGFALLLILGIALALLCALAVGSAVVVLAGAPRPTASIRASTPAASAVSRFGLGLAGSWMGARQLLADNRVNRFVADTALDGARRYPGRVLAVAVALAAIGWGLDTQIPVQSDITKLVPQSLSSLRALDQLEQASGVGGELDLMVSGKNLATPAVIKWMSSYQQQILARFHYSASRGCGHAQICPAFSLPDLFAGATAKSQSANSNSSAAKTAQGPASDKEVRELLGVIPAYFSQSVITADHRVATLAFGIRLMALSDQQRVIETMRSSLHPPKGVSAQLVGLPVLAAQSGSQVASVSRRMLSLLAGVLIVALVLLLVFGERTRTLVVALPVALASGFSALVLFAIRVPLNPMSVTLGALVIAISTEFSVLLAERHRQERQAGHGPRQALARSYSATGRALAASGVTAIAGFGVLALSNITMLRDFGLLTLVDLSVSLLGVLIVLPSVLELAERGTLEHPLRALALARSRRAGTLGRSEGGPRPNETA
jgi:hydrophobe/amphiphile efflux-3 (HAE3) family protein